MWVTSKPHLVCVCECVFVLLSSFLYRYMRVVWVCRKGLVPVFLCTALFFVLSPLLCFDSTGSSVTEKFCLPFGNRQGMCVCVCVCVCF